MKKLLLMQAAVIAFALPAIGQENTDEDIRVEETVFVTIPGPSRTSDELIGNATALDRDDLLDRLDTSLGNMLAKEPGISSTYYGPAASRPIIRGLGAERVLVLTNSLGVIDVSAASPDHQVTGDAIDAERIEILRGPAALAYGGQAVGGVVNVIDGLIAEDIPDAPSGDVLAAYNDVNEGTELAGKGEFAAGPFVFNFSGSFRDADNYEIPDFAESSFQRALEEAEEHDDEDEDHDEDEEHEEEEEVRGLVENSFAETTTLAAGASWVGENAFFGVSIRQQEAEYGLPGGHGHGHEEEEHGDEDEDHDEEEEEEENPFIDLEQTRVDIRGGIELEDSPINHVTGALSVVDYEHTEFEAPGEAGTVYENSGHELRVEAGHNSVFGFEGTFGFQQSQREFSAVGEEAFVTPTDIDRLALFVYEVAEFSDVFGLEGGIRYEKVEYSNVVSGDRDFDVWSGSLGLQGKPSEQFQVGVQLSYTERAPTETELFANGPHLATNQFEIGNPNFDQETAISLEGTARITLDNFTIGTNLYVTDFDDFIYLAPDGTEEDELPVFNFTQEDASFVGGEVYASANFAGFLAANWDVSASIDFVDGEISGGGPLPLQPPTTARVGAFGDWGAFGAGFDVTFADDQTDLAALELPTDSYTLVDVRAEYDISAIADPLAEGSKVFVEVRNLTDEEARISTSTIKDFAPLPGQNVRFGIRASF